MFVGCFFYFFVISTRIDLVDITLTLNSYIMYNRLRDSKGIMNYKKIKNFLKKCVFLVDNGIR